METAKHEQLAYYHPRIDDADFVLAAKNTFAFISSLDRLRLAMPQARIVIFAPFPRTGSLASWRPVAAAHAKAFAPLADNEAVFYVDIGERFFLADGSHNVQMWRMGQAPVGIQPPAFEAWADALQPWLDQFVR